MPCDYVREIVWMTSCSFCVSQEKPSDDEFEIDSDDSEEDDEETIDQAEREEEESRDAELQELEAEKDMPLEKLLEKYSGAIPTGETNEEEEVEPAEDEDIEDGSEGLSGASDSEMDFEEDYKEETAEPIDEGVKEGGLGLESLLDDSLGTQDAATAKLSDAAAIAESFQPKGNTLASTQVRDWSAKLKSLKSRLAHLAFPLISVGFYSSRRVLTVFNTCIGSQLP